VPFLILGRSAVVPKASLKKLAFKKIFQRRFEMENETVMLRIDNPREDLARFLDCQLRPVDFPDGQNMNEFWHQDDKSVYLLITKSKRQRQDGPWVHVNILENGALRGATPFLLKQRLVSVQEVCGPVN
jgi:hypothetical protein